MATSTRAEPGAGLVQKSRAVTAPTNMKALRSAIETVEPTTVLIERRVRGESRLDLARVVLLEEGGALTDDVIEDRRAKIGRRPVLRSRTRG